MLTREATLLDMPDAHRPPPRLTGGLPLLGHAIDLHKRPIELLLRGWREHGELFEIDLVSDRCAVLMGPRAHEAFFRAPEDQLSQRDVYQFTVPIFGTGVAYDAPPALMAEQVGFLHPAVREKRLETYIRHMVEEIAAYTAGWGDDGVLDLDVAMNELTVNIACRCLLGEEVRGRLYEGFARHYHDLQGGINMVGFFLPQAPIPAHLRRDRARRAIGRMIAGIIAERRAHGRAKREAQRKTRRSRRLPWPAGRCHGCC
jgi:sterol 14-demethylase